MAKSYGTALCQGGGGAGTIQGYMAGGSIAARFAVEHGHVDPVVDRKWRAMLYSFRNVGLDVLVAMTAAAAGFARERVPEHVRNPLVAVAVAGVLGTLLNDSGVVVATGAVLAVAPAVIGDTRPR